MKRVRSTGWRERVACVATVCAIALLLVGSSYTAYLILTVTANYSDFAGVVIFGAWSITLLITWLLLSLPVALRAPDRFGSLALLWGAIVPAFLSLLVAAIHPLLVVPQMAVVACAAICLGWLRVSGSYQDGANRTRRF